MCVCFGYAGIIRWIKEYELQPIFNQQCYCLPSLPQCPVTSLPCDATFRFANVMSWWNSLLGSYFQISFPRRSVKFVLTLGGVVLEIRGQISQGSLPVQLKWFYYLLLLFWRSVEVPRPGIKPILQQWLELLQWQHWILNHRCHKGTPIFLYIEFPYISEMGGIFIGTF